MEDAFVHQRLEHLRGQAGLLAAVGFICYALSLLISTVWSGWHERSTFPTDSAYQSHQPEMYGQGLGLVLSAGLWVALRVPGLARSFPAIIWEVLVSGLCTITMANAVLLSPVVVANLRGVDWMVAFGPGHYVSDSGVVLTIDAILTMLHLGVPVRWVSMLPVELAGVLVYAVEVFVIGGPEPVDNGAFNLVLLTGLVAMAAAGKRAIELGERMAFLSILKEKRLRCQAEFQLSEATSRDRRPKGAESLPESKAESSMADSAPSDRIFHPMYNRSVDMTGQLEQVAELGEKEHWRIRAGDATVLTDSLLGQGGFGQVVLGLYAGMVVAVKLLHERLDEAQLSSLCNELRVLRHLRHPNIVGMHGAIVDAQKRQVAVILERIRGVVLHAFILGGAQERKGLECGPLARYQAMLGICKALLYMHGRHPPVVHGDIKSGNVMLELLRDGGVNPKLLDFGCSRIHVRSARPLGGTLSWAAPEVVNDSGQVKRSADIYSFGRLLAFIATSVPPPRGREVFGAHAAGETILPTWPSGCPFEPGCRPTVEACLCFKECDRISIADVHEKLLQLPEELGISNAPVQLLQDVRLFAFHSAKRSQAPGAGRMEGEQQAAPASPEGAQRADAVQNRLPALQEEEPLETRPAQAAAPPPPPPPPPPQQQQQQQQQQQRSSAKTRWRPHPLLPETDHFAMRTTLQEVVTRWNFEAEGPPCCKFHAAMHVVKDLCSSSAKMDCIPLLQWKERQCTECGILGVVLVNGRCDVCEESQTFAEGSGGSGLERPTRMAL